MRQRLVRQVLVLKRRTGPTAGETGPRCGRTCGATRQQRNDDILPVLNCALKKGALGKIPGFGWSSGPRGSINLGSQGKSPFIRWRNRPAGPALGSGQAAGEPAALPLIDDVAAVAIERVAGERRAAGLSADASVHRPCRCPVPAAAVISRASHRDLLGPPGASSPPARQALAQSHFGSPSRWEEIGD